ncbi:MAG: hypothetical protein NTZ90_15515 [Proteobacteria bacterium]|nr:hypothetical protein [Pseudomonadota bacterium]
MQARVLFARFVAPFVPVIIAVALCSGCVTTDHALQSGPAITDDAAFRQWFTFYYQDPHPEQLTAAVKFMQANGYLDETQSEGRDMPLIASVFLSRVMKAHTSELRQWAASWQSLGRQEWYVLLVSLYMADTVDSKRVMAANLHKVDKTHQLRLAGMQKLPPSALDPLTGPVQSERQINLLWAGFSASGDLHYVRKVIGAIPLYGDESGHKAGIGEAALMSLATNALQNETVARECAEVNVRTRDKKTRMLLSAMLAAVAEIARNDQRGQDAISH